MNDIETLESLEDYKREADLTAAFERAGYSPDNARAAAIGITCNSEKLLRDTVKRHQAAQWERERQKLEQQEQEKQKQATGRGPTATLEKTINQAMGLSGQDGPADSQEDEFLRGFCADPWGIMGNK